MTAALTPSDCDLRGLGYMPLDVQRLRDSDLAIGSTGDEFKAAVLLWCVSWSQVPAASLPDDDRKLAALIRMDGKAWKKVREVALSGWVKCVDGRLYHSVVAEKAREAWKDRTKYREKRDKDRARLEAWRAGQKPADETSSHGDGNAIETRSETHVETRFETLPEEKRTGSGVEGIEDADASFVLSGEPKRTRPDPAAEALEVWNVMAARTGLAKARSLDAGRRTAIRARLADGGPKAWKEAITAVERSPHCRGENDRGWRADLDFVCQPKSWRRLLEGFYGGKAASAADQGADWPDSRWAMAIDMWRADGSWGESLGPPPGQPGCRVPTHLLIQPTAQGSAA